MNSVPRKEMVSWAISINVLCKFLVDLSNLPEISCRAAENGSQAAGQRRAR